MLHNGGKAPKISQVHHIAVYDPKDGRIFHMHRTVIFEGAPGHALQNAERLALEHARNIGHDVASLKTLAVQGHVEPGHLQVDLQKNTIVSKPVGIHRPPPATTRK